MAEASGQTDLGDNVDIPPALCAEIRDFARRLPDMNYHEVLGIERDATPDQVRSAFFARSKTFHPDRYYTKELGAYEPLLHEIYKRVVAAHEVLRDEKLRADYEKAVGKNARSPLVRPLKMLALPGAEKAPPAPPAGGGSSLRSRSGLRSKQTVFMSHGE